MDISAIFKRAWEITWKHKGLWVLGILANCSGGGSQGSSNVSRMGEFQFDGSEFPRFDRWVHSVPEETWIAIAIGAVCLVFLLALVFWVLAVIGNGGLIAAFQMAETGETVTLGSAFQKGMRFFWKLLAVQLILGLAALLVFIPVIVGVVGLSVLTLGIGLICLIPLICLLIPVGIVISVYTLLTQIALVVEDLDIASAFRRGWEVLRTKPGEILVMGLILVVGGFVVGLILAIPFVFFALPLITGLVIEGSVSSIAGLSVTIVGILLYLPVLLVAGGIMRTFITGSWTLTYRSLTTTSTA